MQKVIIIQNTGSSPELQADELNQLLDAGWRVLNAWPFGGSVSLGGESVGHDGFAAILVLVAKEDG
ncbi:MAG: hypothetical protein ACOYOS_16840 [Syntrophales bacterium]